LIVVDSQVLVWSKPRESRGDDALKAHAGEPQHRAVPLTGARLVREMDAAGVDRALLLSPTWDRADGEAACAVAEQPGRFRRVLSVRLDAPELAPGPLLASGVAAWRASFWRPETRTWLTDGTADWLWATAEQADAPVMCFLPGGVRGLERIAARHPALRLAVDHMGLSLEMDRRQATEAVRAVVRLASYPNVSVKASALPAFSREGYPFKALHEPFRRVLDAFGPRRVFWGSDLSRLRCGYREVVDLFRTALPMSAEDRSWVLGRGLAAWIRWAPPEEAPYAPAS
jgi:predicted TIM-barrel fold metal-dependent hydrolase